MSINKTGIKMTKTMLELMSSASMLAALGLFLIGKTQ